MGVDIGSAKPNSSSPAPEISNESAPSIKRGVKSLSRWISRRYHKTQKEPPKFLNIQDKDISPGKVDNSIISELNSSNKSSGSAKYCNEVSEEGTVNQHNKNMDNNDISINNSVLVDSVRGRSRSSQVQLLDETWEDWKGDYQKGIYNLSDVSRPTCFNGFGHMSAPLHRNESTRLRAMEKLNNMEIWNETKPWIDQRSRGILHRYRLKSLTVSLLDRTAQKIIFEVGLGYQFDTLGREMSIDAHTVLSSDYFALLDASSDWRTRLNPIVYGPPFIKFYLGIPILYRGVPVGCIAILDPYLKTRVSMELVSELKRFSEELIVKLDSLLETRSLWRSKKSKWRESIHEVQSQRPYNASDDTSDFTTVLAKPRCDADNLSYTSIASSLSLSIFSSSQDSLVAPFMGQKAKYYPISSCRSVIQPYEVFESLLKCSSIHQAIKKACRMVMHNIGTNAVYVAEVRMVQKAQLGDYRSIYNGESVSDIEQKTTIAQLGTSEAKVKLVGSCRPNIDVVIDESFVQRDLSLLKATIPSKYGIKFSFDEPQEHQTLTGDNFCSGMMVPLRRSQPRFHQNGSYGEIHSGGFVMGALSAKPRDFSPGDCTFLKIVSQSLENILTCYDEIHTDKSR